MSAGQAGALPPIGIQPPGFPRRKRPEALLRNQAKRHSKLTKAIPLRGAHSGELQAGAQAASGTALTARTRGQPSVRGRTHESAKQTQPVPTRNIIHPEKGRAFDTRYAWPNLEGPVTRTNTARRHSWEVPRTGQFTAAQSRTAVARGGGRGRLSA